jgi:hypothetical protein
VTAKIPDAETVRHVRTSKLLLLVVALCGLAALMLGRLGSLHESLAFLALLAAAVWNRIDSRGKAYSFQVKGPGGSGFQVKG